MRRAVLPAAAILLAVAVPVAARPAIAAVDVRLAPDTAVTVSAATRLTFDYGQLRSAGGGAAFGVYVVGDAGARSGVILAPALSTAGVGPKPYLVPLWLAAPDRPSGGAAGPRDVPAGTYTLYGLGAATSLRLSAVGGVRVRPAVRTTARALVARAAHPTVIAGATAPVWDLGDLRARSRQRVVVAAQLVRDTVGVGAPVSLGACLVGSATQTCESDDRGDVTYEHYASGYPPSFAEAFHTRHYYDTLDPEATYRVRVQPVSGGPIRSVTALTVVWDVPAGS